MKATHLWFAALAVLASFLAAVPTDARPAPAGLPSPSDLENLNPLNSLRRLENLIDLNVPDHGPRREHLFDLNMPPGPSSQEVEVVRSGLGSGAGEGSSHPPPWDGPRPANVLPQSAEAVHQLRAAQRAAEKRPMSFPDRTSLADHDQGGYINFGAEAPATDMRLLHRTTHGHRAVRKKRPKALGNPSASTDNELAAGKRLKTASTRNEEVSSAARLVLDAVLMKGDARAKVRLGDEQLANELVFAIGTTIGETLQDKVRFVRPSDDDTLRGLGRLDDTFEILKEGYDPRRIWVNDARQGYLIFLKQRRQGRSKQPPVPSGEKAFTAIAFRADDWLRGKRDRTVLGELVIPDDELTRTTLKTKYERTLSDALVKASAGSANAREARAVGAER